MKTKTKPVKCVNCVFGKKPSFESTLEMIVCHLHAPENVMRDTEELSSWPTFTLTESSCCGDGVERSQL